VPDHASVLTIAAAGQFSLRDGLSYPPGGDGVIVPTGASQSGTYSATGDLVTMRFDQSVAGSPFLMAPAIASAERGSAALRLRTNSTARRHRNGVFTGTSEVPDRGAR